LANKNTNFDEYISVVPTSAFLGDGIGNLMAHIVDQCQNRYLEKLAFSEELDCIVMEVCLVESRINLAQKFEWLSRTIKINFIYKFSH